MVQETAEENITVTFFQKYSKKSFGELFFKERSFHHNYALFTIKANSCSVFNCYLIPVKWSYAS